MYIYLLLPLLFVIPFIMDFLFGRRNSREQEWRDLQKNGGGQGKSPTKSSQKDLCEICGLRPKHIEKDGFMHPYCGRTCARAHQQICKYPSCHSPGRSAFSGYCGPGHARDAVQQGHATPCVECGRQPQAIGDLCLGCNSTFGKLAEPRLRELGPQDPTAASLVDNFNHLWRGNESANIGKIYEIRLPRNILKSREAYQSKLAALERPHQIQTFHSTQCICDLGTNRIQFCTWDSCGICAIIRSAFTSFEFGNKSNSGQFGKGVYSYLEPALADKWAVSTTSSPYRVMLACEVNLTPPRAKPSKSSGLLQSREEGPLVFVSGAEAITPKYLILYSKTMPPITQPTALNGRISSYE